MKTEERIQRLEENLLHQEQITDQLSDVLFQQQKQIDRLEKECLRLHSILQATATEGIGKHDTPPPHY